MTSFRTPPMAPAQPGDVVVTTSRRPDSRVVRRAEVVAARCGLRYAPRDGVGLDEVFAGWGASLCYVVARDAEVLLSRDARVMAHPGTAAVAMCQGRRNPLLRAVAPDDEPCPVHVVDATLGLARDALHVAAVLGCRVTGIEAAPLLACLAEGGLFRLASDPEWAGAASRVRVVQGEAATELAALPSGAAEVVVFDPMFDVPAQAAQGFDLLRRVARHGPPDSVALREAARVASRRLVIKVRKDAVAPALPDDLPASLRVPGKAVDYVVVDTREHQRRFVLLVP